MARTRLLAALLGLHVSGCALAPAGPPPSGPPGDAGAALALPDRVVPGTAWRSAPALGHAADAVRRNLRPGQSVVLHDLEVTVVATVVDSVAHATPLDAVRLRLRRGEEHEEVRLGEGLATNWNGYRIAAVAVYGPGELGAGLSALEIATLESLPVELRHETSAGGAAARLRIPHTIDRITLHHTGSAEPLRRGDDPTAILRNLQAWGARDRNWWDVPYHYLIDLDGRVYEGRDWRFAGETNTGYDPAGHFLISVIGNYELQEPTRSQVEAIADMMAWALDRFGLEPDRIGGHYHFADTSCPGAHLRRMLEDGSLQRMAQTRRQRRSAAASSGPQ